MLRRGCLAWVRVAFAAALMLRTTVAAAAPTERAAVSGKIPQRAYVWQRAWTPALCRGLRAHAHEFAAIDILVAELAFDATGAKTSTPTINWPVVREIGVPMAITVRIGPCRSSWASDAAETLTVIATCRAAIADAKSHGVDPIELQIDFDAATARLMDYAQLVRELRRQVVPPTLVITALPAWLDRPEFATLARLADAYVLQVHSLEKPASAAAAATLCDSDKSWAWIEKASRLGRPFRVALPAYGYRVGFTSTGEFIGLQAEGSAPTWPLGTVVRTLWADPVSMAALGHRLATETPRSCEAIVWFRFPSDEDELSWRWPTLAAVMTGSEPTPKLRLKAVPSADGTMELRLQNDGTADAPAGAFRLSWPGAKLIAADGVNGWRIERAHAGAVVRPADLGVPAIRAGESFTIGWLRLDAPLPVASDPL